MATLEQRRTNLLTAIADAEESGGVTRYTAADGRQIEVDLDWLKGQLASVQSQIAKRSRGRQTVAVFQDPGG